MEVYNIEYLTYLVDVWKKCLSLALSSSAPVIEMNMFEIKVITASQLQ